MKSEKHDISKLQIEFKRIIHGPDTKYESILLIKINLVAYTHVRSNLYICAGYVYFLHILTSEKEP